MKISRVIVYVGVITGVCGLGFNATPFRSSDSLVVHGKNVDTFLATYEDANNVKHLDLSETDVIELSIWVCRFTTLTTLNLSGTKVSDITALSCLSSLEELDLTGTKVTNISFLKKNLDDKLTKLPNLKTLFLIETCVEDISALNDRELEYLDLTNTPVDLTDTSALHLVNELHLPSIDPSQVQMQCNKARVLRQLIGRTRTDSQARNTH